MLRRHESAILIRLYHIFIRFMEEPLRQSGSGSSINRMEDPFPFRQLPGAFS